MQEDKERGFTVTIDGPAASGKSTTARLVAKKLGWLYLDTGAMYRAVAVKVLQEKIPVNNTKKIGLLAEKVKIELVPYDAGTKVFLDGKEVTADIRHPEVDQAVGPVCEVQRVREVMVSLQREIGKKRCIVVEGRDMGTVVFPNAAVKFFMVASVEERAQRRQKDLKKQGINISLAQLKREIEKRDQRDSTRKNSPLLRAEDAILIDTTKMDVEDQVDFIMDRIRQKKKAG